MCRILNFNTGKKQVNQGYVNAKEVLEQHKASESLSQVSNQEFANWIPSGMEFSLPGQILFQKIH